MQQRRVIADDLNRLRPLVSRRSDALWLRLLIAALDQLVWDDEQLIERLAEGCREEIDRLEHLHLPMADELENFEFLDWLASGWRVLRRERPSSPLVRLIPASWTRDFTEVRPLLLGFLGEVALEPWNSLTALDQIYGVCSAIMVQVWRLMMTEQHEVSQPLRNDKIEENLASLVLEFLHDSDRFRYFEIRRNLLDFCLREMVAPETLGRMAAEHQLCRLSPHQDLKDAIASDLPLRAVYLAQRMFWG